MFVSVRRCAVAANTTGATPCAARRARTRRSRHGFSLIEAVTVAAIISIVTGIVVGGIELLRKSGAFTGASGDIITGLRKTRAEAFGRGTYTAFIIDTAGGRRGGSEAPPGGELSPFKPPPPRTGVGFRRLPQGTGFWPAAPVWASVPAPLSGIPTL